MNKFFYFLRSLEFKKNKRGKTICLAIRLNNSFYIQNIYTTILMNKDIVDKVIIYYNSLSKKDEEKLINIFSDFQNVILKARNIDKKDFNKWIINYSNNLLSEVQEDWTFIFDSDVFFPNEIFRKIIKKTKRSSLNTIIYFSLINLYRKESNVGFSDFNKNDSLPPFVGCGDHLIFPTWAKGQYNEKFELRFLNLNSFLFKKYLGLTGLHVSKLNEYYKDSNLFHLIKLDEIKKNTIRNNEISEFSKNFYLKIIKKTKRKTLTILEEMCSKMFN